MFVLYMNPCAYMLKIKNIRMEFTNNIVFNLGVNLFSKNLFCLIFTPQISLRQDAPLLGSITPTEIN